MELADRVNEDIPMVKIDFTGAGQYWLSCPEPTDSNGGVAGGGALWIDLGECETEADILAAVNEYTEAAAGAICQAEMIC
jgi:hypothetical protein